MSPPASLKPAATLPSLGRSPVLAQEERTTYRQRQRGAMAMLKDPLGGTTEGPRR